MQKIQKEKSRKISDSLYGEYETIQSIIAYEWLPDNLNDVLEIGCSRGYFTQKLLNKARRAYGVDVNAELVQSAKRHYPVVDFRTLDANDPLPFEDGMFDAVVMLEVYEHVDSRKKLIDEVARVLKPGGILILSTPNKGLFAFMDSFNIKMMFRKLCPNIMKFIKKNVQKYENVQYTENIQWHPHFSLRQLRDALEGRFAVREVHRGGLFLFPLFAIFRSVLIRTFPSKTLFKFFVDCMNADGRISYGPFGYNLQIFAVKEKQK